MAYNTIRQNDDDEFYTAVCAYVRGEPNGIVPGTVGEEQAEIAKRLLQDNPAILAEKDRLLAELRKDWLVHSGRVDRDCISKAEYDRRMGERRAAGLLIDPSTAEIGCSMVLLLDPYYDGLPLLREEEEVGHFCFARAPDSGIWVSDNDLPDATRHAIWKRCENASCNGLEWMFD
jgi:hypothetical protein